MDNDDTTWLSKTVELACSVSGAGDFIQATIDSGFWFSAATFCRALLALSMLLAALAFCMRLIRIALPTVGLPARLSSILCVGIWIASAVFQLLLAMSAFSLALATIGCLALLAIASRAMPRKVPLRWAVHREWRGITRGTKLLVRGPHATINGIFIAFGALFALRALLVPPLGWDWFTYHGPRAAGWVASGRFTFDDGPGPLGYYRNFFAGAEVLVAWSMLPFDSDLFVNLGLFVQWIALGLSAWALGRAAGLREPFAATGAGVTLFASTMQMELNSGYVEIPLIALLCHGTALAILFCRRASPALAVLSAASIGVAIGVKITAAPLGAVVLLVLLVRTVTMRGLSLGKRLSWMAAAACCALLPVAPWIANAWRNTGYPLSPMPVEIAGIRLGVAAPALTWLQWRPELTPHEWATELPALERVLAPLASPFTEALGSMAMIPFIAAPLGAVALLRRRLAVSALLCVLTTIPLAVHFSESMSAIRLLWPANSSRHLLVSLTFATVLSLSWCRRDGACSQLYRRLLLSYPLVYGVLCARWGWGAWETPEAVIVGVALALAGVLLRRAFRHGARAGSFALAVVLGLATSALQIRRDQTRVRAFAHSFALHPFKNSWVEAMPMVDDPARPHHIAITGGENHHADTWFMYPFLGRRLQNVLSYVVPTADGRIADFGPFGDFRERAQFDAWLDRLKAKGIEEVVTFEPRSIEQTWMDERPAAFQRLAGDASWGLYRLIDR
jgi:hypothetical protein